MILGAENLESVSGIYCAIHRDTGACYVGSSINVGRRRRQHLKASRAGKHSCFAKAVRRYGEDAFDFEILERCERPELLRREEFYIALLGAASADGFNTRTRACAPYDYKHLPASKDRISAAMKGRILSAATRTRMSASMSGKKKGPMSEAHRQAIAAGLKSYKRTASHCAAISLGQTGKKFTPETRQKMRDRKLGKPLTKKHRDALRAGHAKRRALIKGVIVAELREVPVKLAKL